MGDVSSLASNFARLSLYSSYWSIGTVDYIILYAPSGQTGETMIKFSVAPTFDLKNSPNVSVAFPSTTTVVMNYSLSGSQFIPITAGDTSVVVILMDKPTANKWHAPIIAGSGTFDQFFSVGTNQRRVF